MSEGTQRRLAAIVSADVVGYSRLMDADEAGTLARLKSIRSEILDPQTEAFGGRVFKNTGDGAMAEFASSVDAVQCAIEIQRALGERNVYKRRGKQQQQQQQQHSFPPLMITYTYMFPCHLLDHMLLFVVRQQPATIWPCSAAPETSTILHGPFRLDA